MVYILALVPLCDHYGYCDCDSGFTSRLLAHQLHQCFLWPNNQEIHEQQFQDDII